MKPYSSGRAELSRRKSDSKRLVDENTYPTSEEDDHTDDEDAFLDDFDRQSLGWAGSYAQNSKKPLVDYCTNEWKENPYQRDYWDQLDLEFEDDTEEWYDYCLDCLRSRKTRRWALFITSLLVFLVYLFSTIPPRIEEDRLLTESLRLRDPAATGKLFGGVFGNNVRPSFSDMIHMKTLDKKYLPGKHNSKDSGRLIFVGDIHGCKEELQALLKEVLFDSRRDHLVTTGDMIAKGPDSLGTVDLLREIGASCVRGNHEDRILLLARALNSTRLHQNGARDDAALERPSNPPSKWPDESLSVQLDAYQIGYLQSCPVILKIGHVDALHGDVVAVHAGLVPGVPLKDQDPGSVMTMRTIDLHSHVPSKDGKEGPVKDTNRKPPLRTPMGNWPARKPAHNVHWAKLWNRFQKMLPEFKKWQYGDGVVVVYGHDSKRGLQVKKWSKGLDSGCVNGGRLTALVVGGGGKKEELVSVKCKDYRS
jgi:Calcineurin-like phosphoesterase